MNTKCISVNVYNYDIYFKVFILIHINIIHITVNCKLINYNAIHS